MKVAIPKDPAANGIDVSYTSPDDLKPLGTTPAQGRDSTEQVTLEWIAVRKGKGEVLLRTYGRAGGRARFPIWYTCEALDTLSITTDSIGWTYQWAGAALVDVCLAGQTNAHRLLVSHLGGIGLFVEIPLGTDGTFSDSVRVCYCRSKEGLGADALVLLYGMYGPPVPITLVNPNTAD